MDAAYVRTEFHHGVTTVEFYHPQSNSLPGKILEQLAQAIHGAGNDVECRVILIKAGGDRAFCAGASFDELAAIDSEDKGFQFFNGFAQVINAIRLAPKFVVGRIHGRCVGGGVGLAAAVDYAIATQEAEVRLSELAIGIGPFVIGPAVERKIGLSAFSQLAIDAQLPRGAEWARNKGLFAEVHPNTASMDESIRRLLDTLALSNPQAMSELKKVMWKGTEHWDQLLPERAAISGRLVLSDFTRQAIASFRKK